MNDLPHALNETGLYLYANNTCILYQDKDVEKIEQRKQRIQVLKQRIFVAL